VMMMQLNAKCQTLGCIFSWGIEVSLFHFYFGLVLFYSIQFNFNFSFFTAPPPRLRFELVPRSCPLVRRSNLSC